MRTAFYTLATILLAVLLLKVLSYEPPVGDTVSPQRLADAARLSAQHPTQAAQFRHKIESSTLTNGDFVQLQLAADAADAELSRTADEEFRRTSPRSWWMLHFGTYIATGVALLCVVTVQIIRLWNAPAGERRFFGFLVG